MAVVAFLLLCGQAYTARAQVADDARFGASPVVLNTSVGGQEISSPSSPVVVSATRDEPSATSSNVRKHVVVGAVIGVAAGIAIASFEMMKCADRNPQSDKEECAIILVAAVPATGLLAVVGGFFGWISADHTHPMKQD